MKRSSTAAALIAAMLLSACTPDAPESPAPVVETDEAEALLESFREEVRNEVAAKLATLTDVQIIEGIRTSAERVLEPNMEKFQTRTRKELDALPVLSLNETDYSPASPDQQAIIDETIGNVEGYARFSGGGTVLPTFWDPLEVARATHNLMRSKLLPSQEYTRLAMLEKVLAPEISRLEVDGQDPHLSPVIAVESGQNLCLVTLEYNDTGIYLPTGVRWLHRNN